MKRFVALFSLTTGTQPAEHPCKGEGGRALSKLTCAISLAGLIAATGCAPTFPIVSRLQDQGKSLESGSSCPAPDPGNFTPPSPIAASGNPSTLATSVNAVQLPSSTLAERYLATRAPFAGPASSAGPQALQLGSATVLAVQQQFIADPLATRDSYLQGLGALGSENFVRIAANTLLSARARNLAKLGVVTQTEAQVAMGKLRGTAPFSQRIVRAFTDGKREFFMPGVPIPGSAAAAKQQTIPAAAEFVAGDQGAAPLRDHSTISLAITPPIMGKMDLSCVMELS